MHHFSTLTVEGRSIAYRVIRTIRKLLKEPVFLAANADRVSEVQSVIKKCSNSIHSSTKMKPIDAFKKSE